jgi:hypothetical protein
MQLSREQTFELWAPEESRWAVWAKPVLFACLGALGSNQPLPQQPPPPPDISSWVPKADGSTLLVVDLPGVQSVQLGEALALVGFRPLPLFNAVSGPNELVQVRSIVRAIQQVSARARAPLSSLPSDAPPAFLLDADRRLGRVPRAGDFDNRSISLPTDFPSANFLQSRGVSQVLLINTARAGFVTEDQPASDLAHTLLRWQLAGLQIRIQRMSETFEVSAPRAIEVKRPPRFRAIWHNALSLLGLRRNPLGGFGGTLPVPSSG